MKACWKEYFTRSSEDHSLMRIKADLNIGFVEPNNIPPLLNYSILILQCLFQTCSHMLRCEVGFCISNLLIDVEFLQVILNCDLRDPEADIIGNILERYASELKSNLSEVFVIIFGCDMLILTTGTALFELYSGIFKDET